MADLRICAAALEVIRQEAARSQPTECCGLLLGQEQAITHALPAANIHADPLTHFEIDPQALVDAHRAARQGGPQVLGYYHSHPAGPARPSATDAAMASGDRRIWAIIGRDSDVTCWRDDQTGFAELSYSIVSA